MPLPPPPPPTAPAMTPTSTSFYCRWPFDCFAFSPLLRFFMFLSNRYVSTATHSIYSVMLCYRSPLTCTYCRTRPVFCVHAHHSQASTRATLNTHATQMLSAKRKAIKSLFFHIDYGSYCGFSNIKRFSRFCLFTIR